MSQPENSTSGRYFLRSGKPATPLLATPIAHSSRLHTLLDNPLIQPLLTPTRPLGPIISPALTVQPTTPPPPPLQPLHITDSASSTHSTPPSSPEPDSAEQSDSEDMASGTNSLLPAPFTGRDHEDVVQFIKNFHLWATFRKMANDERVAALPLLLKDGAAVWYHTQPTETRRDLKELQDALHHRYGPRVTDAWKRSAELWGMRQQQGQSTDDFLTAVQQAAQKLDAPETQTFQVALHGLRPSIRQHVIQHDPSSVEDLRKWGRVTEMSQTDQSDTEKSLRDTVQELSAVKEALQQLQLTHVAAINTNKQRSRSPTPHRVSFATPPVSTHHDDRHTDDFRRGHQRASRQPYDYDQPAAYNNQNSVAFPRGQQQSDRPPRNDYNTGYPQPQQRRQPSTWRQNYTPSSCGNCGGKHHPQSFCRAKGATCFYCQKRGHLQSMCRAAQARGHYGPR